MQIDETPVFPLIRTQTKTRTMFTDTRAVNSIIAIMLMMAIAASAVTGFLVFYKDFAKQSTKETNMDLPQVTIYGPTSAKPGQTISLWVQNSGTIDFTSWTVTQGTDENGQDLKVGDKIAIATTLEGQGPWSFSVLAETTHGKQIEDAWAVQNT